ncbi:hypothetical protein WG66_014298 [Moniliophthora roreri]|nr:hypothetical protein WG66_014298 [Moniliophthora roreri]
MPRQSPGAINYHNDNYRYLKYREAIHGYTTYYLQNPTVPKLFNHTLFIRLMGLPLES